MCSPQPYRPKLAHHPPGGDIAPIENHCTKPTKYAMNGSVN